MIDPTDALTPCGWGRPPVWTTRVGSGSDNEDAVRVLPGLAVVADGAGVAPEHRAGCRHSVAWYSQHLVDAMVHWYADRSIGQRDALERAIHDVRELHPECDLEAGSPSATIACFRTHGTTMEHLVMCDAALLLRLRDGTATMVTDTRIDECDRTLPMEAQRNRPGGFWLPQHDPAVAGEALVATVPLEELDGIAACSDGITRALDRLGLHDVASLTAAALDDPLEGLVDAIRMVEADGVLRPGKVHDDATVARLTPNPTSKPPNYR